jgi:hypothetical protein
VSRPELVVPDAGDRRALAEFVGRLVRLDPSVAVRLRGSARLVSVWAATPFEALTERSVPGELRPADLTVPGHALLAALEVVRGDAVDPTGASTPRWLAELPPLDAPWVGLAEMDADELRPIAERAVELANELGVPAVLNRPMLAVPGAARSPAGPLLALSGLGLLDDDAPVRLESTDDWMRLAVPAGAVVYRRRALLPLLV